MTLTLNELIERLNWLKQYGVDGDTIINVIRPINSYVQIEFKNGVISQVSSNSSKWKITNGKSL